MATFNNCQKNLNGEHTTYAILGAGPAGVQLSYFLLRLGIDHVLLERGNTPGTFFRSFPRHRKLISINKIHTGSSDAEKNLRWDWNSLLSDENSPLLSEYSSRYFPQAEDFVAYLQGYVERHNIDIEYGFDVVEVSRKTESSSGTPASGSERFLIRSHDGRRRSCDRLIVATGLSKGWVPEIPGVEHCEHYGKVSVRPQDFVAQRVLILGKGNSAFETADNLIETTASIHLASPTPLRMAWQTHFVGHLRAVNNNFLDTYQLKSQNAVLDASVQKIEKYGKQFRVTFEYAHANEEVETLTYDRIILCTGFKFDDSFFASSCRPLLTDCGKLPRMSSQWESENVPGLFFAGAVMQYRDYKRFMSAFIHGFRYNIRALTRMLELRYHETPWPSRAVRPLAEDVAQALLDRVNRSSAIWQQPGFLGDIVELKVGAGNADYFEEVPLDYAAECVMPAGHWLQLTMEYGTRKPVDPFCVDRVHREDVQGASDSTFLHPVVRYFADGALAAEHHVIEDLEAEWKEPEHALPLIEFVAGVLSQAQESGTDQSGRPVPEYSGFSPAETADATGGDDTEQRVG